MAPDAESCERAERAVAVHAGRRVGPDERAGGARAWHESEDVDSPGESRRLLAPAHPSPSPPPHACVAGKSLLQAGLTLGVWPAPKKSQKCSLTQKFEKPLPKTKYEKRREKLVEALRPPYFILCMITIIVVVHVCCGERVRAALEWSPAAWRREPWRLLTYGCVHASAAHLALNALVGLAVGWRLEREQTWWRAACVWAGGVLAGAMGAGALQPSVRVVGSSAAVYALLTAHLANVCLRFGHVPLWWFRPLSVVVLALSEASWTLLRVRTSDSHDHVAWAAHVFGALIGVPLAFLVFTGENVGKRHVVWCRAVSLAALSAGGATAALYYYHCQRAVHT